MNLDRLKQKLHQQHQGIWWGDIQSIFTGSGSEIHDFRRYAAGDSPRSINRKMTAKHDALWVNTRLDDKDISIHILLDINANWQGGMYTSHRSLVQEWLGDYILFAQQQHIRHTHMRRPGEEGCDTSVYALEAQWYRGLDTWNTRVRQSGDTYTSCLTAFTEHMCTKQKKSIIIVFSDFLDEDAELSKRLMFLGSKHDLVRIALDVPQVIGKNFVSL